MGNSSKPGSVPGREVDHEPFEVDEEQYFVRELVWNGGGRSYDLVRCCDDQVLTEQSFGKHPTDEQIAAVLEEHGAYVDLETCKFCGGAVLLATAHRHEYGWVGDTCCWDRRLRSTA
ncbi:hypothetical protein [Streptomyces sp. NPDC046985]|uniref:hypothetical protein n=1 Tax=Streptomyces sp. NPDC046985 TaxID=3155377 RepID=UPI0033E57130